MSTVATVAMALLISGCAGPQVSRANATDAFFARSMIERDLQAISMSELVDNRSDSNAVRDMAEEIIAYQEPAATAMTGWLTTWERQTPAKNVSSTVDSLTTADDPGLFTSTDLKRLSAKEDEEFDLAFLAMMIAHHQAALALAATEEELGSDVHAVQLAQRIQETQTGQIQTMKALQGSIRGGRGS